MQRLCKRGARTVRPATTRPQLDRLEDRVYPGDVLQLLGWTALGTSLPPLLDPDPWASPLAVMSGIRESGAPAPGRKAPVPADAPESGALGLGNAVRGRPRELTAAALLSRLLTAGGDGSAAADSPGRRLEWSGPGLNWDWLGDPFADLFRTERDPATRRRPAPADSHEAGRPDLGDGGAVGGLAPRTVLATPPATPDGLPTGGTDPLLLAVQGEAFRFSSGGETAPPPPVAPPPEPPPGDQPLPRLDANSIRHNYARLPLAFEPNRGQAEAGVNFLARAPGYGIALTPTEAALVLSKRLDGSAARPRAGLRMQLVGANPTATPQGLEELPGRSNYFLGNDPRRWVTNLPQYAQVRYQDVYPGIHALYYGTSRRQLEFDFVVTPGADPGRIQLAFPATPNLRLDARGDLVLPGAGGDVVAKAPVAYQLAGGTRQAVSVRYDVGAGRRVGFQLGAYDPGRELYIDPVIHYSAYLGGEGDDSGADIAVDTAGNAHVVGTVSSNEVFTASGGAEVFVSKLDPTGTKVLYTDYFGGSGHDEGVALALDMAGSAYITGTTSSADFVTTQGAFQRTLQGGEDVFVVKLNAAGNMVYSTLLGGSTGTDGAGDLAVDGAGQVHVTGHTSSGNFPVTLGTAWFPVARGGFDAFVTRLNAAGTALGYGTFLGGSGDDYGTGLAVDSQGRAVVTGRTASTNFPTVGALQSSKAGGDDVFITQLNAAGSGGVFSSYLGGSGDDEAHDLALDPLGNHYLTGITRSNNFPTVNAYQATRPSPPDDDGFVTKVLAGGSAWGFSTYLGGNGADRPYGLAVDYTGSTYVTGWTSSSNYPTLNPVTTGQDLFITQLEPSGSALAFSTTYGGGGTDEGRALAVDPLRNVYATGWTQSQDFPTTPSFQGWGGGNTDAFLLKLDPRTASASTIRIMWRQHGCLPAQARPAAGGAGLHGHRDRQRRQRPGPDHVQPELDAQGHRSGQQHGDADPSRRGRDRHRDGEQLRRLDLQLHRHHPAGGDPRLHRHDDPERQDRQADGAVPGHGRSHGPGGDAGRAGDDLRPLAAGAGDQYRFPRAGRPLDDIVALPRRRPEQRRRLYRRERDRVHRGRARCRLCRVRAGPRRRDYPERRHGPGAGPGPGQGRQLGHWRHVYGHGAGPAQPVGRDRHAAQRRPAVGPGAAAHRHAPAGAPP
jgi:hypothetical protein